MKNIILAIVLTLLSTYLKSQDKNCLDVFGNSCECPTSDDSILVYENSLKILQFYERNDFYRKIKIKKIVTEKDVEDCFRKLDSAYQAFRQMWQLRERFLKGENVDVLMPRDGHNIPISDYFDRIDDYRFYQREFECGILNTTSPYPIYDIRISPLYINTYRNHTSSDIFNGDEVQIAMYMPVTVKPYTLLTSSEIDLRNKLLKGTDRAKSKKLKPTREDILSSIVVDTSKEKPNVKSLTISLKQNSWVENKVLPDLNIPLGGTSVYYSNGITGSLIGFLDKNGYFTKIDKSRYKYIHKFAVNLLQDDNKLKAELRVKFGIIIKIVN
jgi:hypothetical protein